MVWSEEEQANSVQLIRKVVLYKLYEVSGNFWVMILTIKSDNSYPGIFAINSIVR